jgi:hypothetical protein
MYIVYVYSLLLWRWANRIVYFVQIMSLYNIVHHQNCNLYIYCHCNFERSSYFGTARGMSAVYWSGLSDRLPEYPHHPVSFISPLLYLGAVH